MPYWIKLALLTLYAIFFAREVLIHILLYTNKDHYLTTFGRVERMVFIVFTVFLLCYEFYGKN